MANNLVDGAANGISVANFDQGGRLATVSGNIVRNLTTVGPYETQPPGFGTGIAAEADTAITGTSSRVPLSSVCSPAGPLSAQCSCDRKPYPRG